MNNVSGVRMAVILTLEPDPGACPPPPDPARAGEAEALPPAHHSATVGDQINKEGA